MSTRSNIFVTTKDSVHIVGTLVLPDETPRACALLLHMMPSNRKSFSVFQEALAQKDITSLAIDLRGHGESIQQKNRILDYKKFTDNDHQQSIHDVDAAFKYLLSFTGFPLKKSVLVGASIGANLAMRYHHENPAIGLSLALSPGLAYRGIDIQDVGAAIHLPSRMILVSSKDDSYSLETIQRLTATPSDAVVSRVVEGSEHGTDLFLDIDFFSEAIELVASITEQG